jgi:glycerol-1-phosphate dehydrogenase [NAD(P)+]
MNSDISIYIGQDAATPLIDYCKKTGIHQLMMVADENTYIACGEQVETRLKNAGFDLKTTMLVGDEILPNEHFIMQVLLNADRQDRTYLAVGSGVITDITRFVSHRTKANFISVPTAASVDGYTGAGAPLVVGGFKKTIYAHSPLAIFADLEVLSAAPQEMTASGFGDMLGKFIALADWRLGSLLWDEPFDEDIYHRVRDALQNCVDHAEAIGQASTEGLQVLLDGLIESGLCMLDFNNSRPASGSEHQISHYLEMRLIEQQRPAVLHGAKVGVSTIIMAGLYEQLRGISRDELLKRLEVAQLTPADQHRQTIRAAFPAMDDKVEVEQAKFLAMSEQDFAQLKRKIIDYWPDIQAIAATVPGPKELTTWLKQVGGATTMQSLGFSEAEVTEAIKHAHYLRDRFNVDKLGHIIGGSVV